MTIDDVQKGVARNRDEFFHEVEALLSPQSAEVGDEIYLGIRPLLPGPESPFSSVTFSSTQSGAVRRISIDQQKADQVRKIHEKSTDKPVVVAGSVIEINASSKTALVRSPLGGVTTCAFDAEKFKDLMGTGLFRIGSKIKVSGLRYERVRRDYLSVLNIIDIQHQNPAPN
ncbi:hypothetical protein [Mesorhizobium amorphae]|uniref:hypothetical protein n=1 Tax=Mesorhizobium amorphae TaxID=71433 RepID=UPI001184561B|nr:hypothetical protein [Mesorhizobium amorphae]